ncbi:MAG: hypothetical protein IRZ21_11695 [Thermoleophilaceae bacterium]|nr:hypothetical protein [Thermoleophilaceae bacterium]
MTTPTQAQVNRRLAELDLLAQEAWLDYRESVRELRGREYEDEEDRSWLRLQERLRELDGERRLLVAG